ncbi:E3 ubiquitin-protein ligase [Salix suchowensis]|nr:E3 ubiquitin-protein ligase [Salix suchowensis]
MTSLINRPRVTVNGIRRMRAYHFFWCQHCQRISRFTSINRLEIFCPNCYSAINHELDVSMIIADTIGLESSPGSLFLYSLAQMLDPPTRRQDAGHVDNNGNADHDLLTQDMIDHSDLPGPPPAPVSAIEALPIVEITEKHLMNDMHCPVCLYELRDESDNDLPGENDQFFGFEEETNNINWLRNRFQTLRPIRAFSNRTQRYLDFLDSRLATSNGAGSWWRSWLIL